MLDCSHQDASIWTVGSAGSARKEALGKKCQDGSIITIFLPRENGGGCLVAWVFFMGS